MKCSSAGTEQLLWCYYKGTRHTECWTLCVDGCVLPGEISYPSPKIAGKVKKQSNSIQIRISCFSGADFCCSIYFTVSYTLRAKCALTPAVMLCRSCLSCCRGTLVLHAAAQTACSLNVIVLGCRCCSLCKPLKYLCCADVNQDICASTVYH